VQVLFSIVNLKECLDWQPFFGQIYTEHKTSFI